jgi:hypothetical protein
LKTDFPAVYGGGLTGAAQNAVADGIRKRIGGSRADVMRKAGGIKRAVRQVGLQPRTLLG